MQAWKAVLLSFLLGPGIGQFYNREYKKGVYLMGLSLIVLVGFSMWFYHACQPYLPADLPVNDRQALQSLLQNAADHVMSSDSMTLNTYKGLLFVIWVYGVFDAWLGAQKRIDTNNH